MPEHRFLLYDSADNYSNDIIQELKNSNILSTFTLVDKQTVDQTKLNTIIKKCLISCKLPTLLVPNTTMPIERDAVKNWIRSTQLFGISTNNIRSDILKKQKIIEPSPQDKMGIPKQEIKKISDTYTFIDDKNTIKAFQEPNTTNLILKDDAFTTKIISENQNNNEDQKKRVLRMIRGKK
jgi:hypothetical protein